MTGESALIATRKLLRWPARKVKMHVRCLEQVVLDLVVVGQRPDDVGADVAFVVEGFQPAPDAGVGVFDKTGLLAAGAVHGVGGEARVRVRPQLHFDGAGAVVELVGCVGGLGGDVADLADEGDLRVGCVVVSGYAGESQAGLGEER